MQDDGHDAYQMVIESDIESTVDKAQEIVDKRLEGAHALIDEVKKAMSHGTECISTEQLQEWAVAIPIICEELATVKEAFSLTKELWDIETKRICAKNLLELEKKKVEIETINKLTGAENGSQSALAEYGRNRIGGCQEALWMLGNTIRKILDVRIASGNTR